MTSITRRSLMQSAPPALIATVAAAGADDMDHDDYSAAEGRVRLFATTIGKEPPARLTSEDGAPSPELLAFCAETGMSLDWVFVGDPKAMILATYRDRLATTETHIQRIYKRWEIATAQFNRLADESTALLENDLAAGDPDARKRADERERQIVNPAYQTIIKLEDEAFAQPVENARDLAVKALMALRVEDTHDLEQFRILKRDADRVLTA